jgi:hypothetical protein
MYAKYGKTVVIINSNKLEHYHLEAAIIITGVLVFTKSELVCHEIGKEEGGTFMSEIMRNV